VGKGVGLVAEWAENREADPASFGLDPGFRAGAHGGNAMQGFILDLANQPGTFADTAEKLAQKGVNLLICGLTSNGSGYVGLVTSDDASTRETLDDIRCKYREVEVIPVSLEHVPGTSAKMTRTLSNAGINIEFFMPTGESGGKTVVALGVDRVEDARRVLGNQVISDYGSLWPKAVARIATA
jgi:hypothetical protein